MFFREVDKVSWRDQFIIAYGGLRGAIAFALAYLLEEEVEPRNYFITATLIVIWFTVFIMGTTIKPVLSLLRVRRASAKEQNLAEKTFLYPLGSILSCVNLISGHSEETRFMQVWQYVIYYIIFS